MNELTIYHDVPVMAPLPEVFAGIATAEGLSAWWTDSCEGDFREGGTVRLFFTPEYDWKAKVTRFVDNNAFELEMQDSDPDWEGTRVGFILENHQTWTKLRFYHSGWEMANDHYRTSSYCWATYLRLLKRFIEKGERVPYAERDFA
jgi:uncharacterized protein YndB with AHSA1/START domain